MPLITWIFLLKTLSHDIITVSCSFTCVFEGLNLGDQRNISAKSGDPPEVAVTGGLQRFNYSFIINTTDVAFKAKFNTVKKVRLV